MAVNNLNTPGVGIQPSIVDAKGDLLVGTAADAISRLGVTGTTGAVLTADAGETTGLKWAAAGSVGGLVHIETVSMSAAAQENLNSVFSSTYKKYKIIITQSAATQNGQTYIRLRAGATTDTTSNYFFGSQNITSAATSTASTGNPSSVFFIGNAFSSTLGSTAYYEIILHNPFESTRTGIGWNGYSFDNTVEQARVGAGILKTTTSYDGFSYLVSAGNASAVISVYGFKE